MFNEILENVIKFWYYGDVEIWCMLDGNCFEFEILNVINFEMVIWFQVFLMEILVWDLGELLLEWIEVNVFDMEFLGFGFGFLMLMSDYDVKFGWCFMLDDSKGLVNLKIVVVLIFF